MRDEIKPGLQPLALSPQPEVFSPKFLAIILLGLHELLKRNLDFSLDGFFEKRGCSEQGAFHSKSHPGPFVEIKGVPMADNFSILELKRRLDDIVNLSPGQAKGVTGFPVGRSLAVISLHITEGHIEVFCPFTQHVPHCLDFFSF